MKMYRISQRGYDTGILLTAHELEHYAEDMAVNTKRYPDTDYSFKVTTIEGKPEDFGFAPPDSLESLGVDVL